VDFEEAARRTAQIGFDLRIDGITAFFSWPSRGRIFPYMHDEEAVQVAEPHFIDFIDALAQAPGLEEINILAHSMGNRLLMRTIQELARAKTGLRRVTIGQVILAAADVPAEVFLARAEFYRDAAGKRVTSYSCDRDLPLRMSRLLHRRNRVGLEPPIFICPGVDTISAAKLNLHGLGHGYYAETEALLYDMNELIHDNTHPNRRTRIEPGKPEFGQYWVFGR
jgi:esterase/lipase superfamily enzyme